MTDGSLGQGGREARAITGGLAPGRQTVAKASIQASSSAPGLAWVPDCCQGQHTDQLFGSRASLGARAGIQASSSAPGLAWSTIWRLSVPNCPTRGVGHTVGSARTCLDGLETTSTTECGKENYTVSHPANLTNIKLKVFPLSAKRQSQSLRKDGRPLQGPPPQDRLQDKNPRLSTAADAALVSSNVGTVREIWRGMDHGLPSDGKVR
ncbi:hypothetical protein Bbelb_097300 [Branchiostoma belcheri]|nr:hypothetical protein Bbelb_097300 [Branchiostoma belcheri]